MNLLYQHFDFFLVKTQIYLLDFVYLPSVCHKKTNWILVCHAQLVVVQVHTGIFLEGTFSLVCLV